MDRFSRFSKLTMLVLFLSGFMLACGTFLRLPQSIAEDAKSADTGSETHGIENGERIYFTATNVEGKRIPHQGGPEFGGMMMGTYLTCAACHGPQARGGSHWMHMQVMDAPDIRYTALSEETGDHEEEGDEHTDEHADYDLDDFRLAVVEGKHPDGDPLSSEMPRWQMDEADLNDLFAFLKSIP